MNELRKESKKESKEGRNDGGEEDSGRGGERGEEISFLHKTLQLKLIESSLQVEHGNPSMWSSLMDSPTNRNINRMP